MSGMLGVIKDKTCNIRPEFITGHSMMDETNECADLVIASPDRYLLPQDKLFEAEGGWGTCALTIGLGLVGVGTVMALNSRIGAHLGRGTLRFSEWGQLGAAALLCGGLG